MRSPLLADWRKWLLESLSKTTGISEKPITRKIQNQRVRGHNVSVFFGSCLLLELLLLVPPTAQHPQEKRLSLHDTVLRIGGGQIDITLPDEQVKVSAEELLAWVKAAANAVSEYYGHFPVEHLTLGIRAGNGAGIRHGMTYPRGGGLILISVG